MEPLPTFRYHPDPVRTGAVTNSNTTCICCGEVRGFIYVASVYSRQQLRDQLCPWCIANGEAAKRFDASFSDSTPLIQAKVPREVVDEVTERTPGFNSWQEGTWLSHCGDACIFEGEASKEDLERISADFKASFMKEFHLDEAKWDNIKKHYAPGGEPGIYKFVCRHCRNILLGMDFT
jgi:uncharacterized protein